MNGSFPYTSSWIGSLGEYSIYEYLNQMSKNSSNYTSNTSNTLETHLYNTSNIFPYVCRVEFLISHSVLISPPISDINIL